MAEALLADVLNDDIVLLPPPVKFRYRAPEKINGINYYSYPKDLRKLAKALDLPQYSSRTAIIRYLNSLSNPYIHQKAMFALGYCMVNDQSGVIKDIYPIDDELEEM